VDEAAAKVTENGGTIAMPKMAIPGVGHQMYCIDPGGILFGLHQTDPSAR
jgi:predicted enzyme related to lactoylglutathione lyase